MILIEWNGDLDQMNGINKLYTHKGEVVVARRGGGVRLRALTLWKDLKRGGALGNRERKIEPKPLPFFLLLSPIALPICGLYGTLLTGCSGGKSNGTVFSAGPNRVISPRNKVLV